MKPRLRIYQPPEDGSINMVRDGLPSWRTILLFVAFALSLCVIAGSLCR